ncbi:cyclin-like protein [Fimicolochytrium jonesii]|uniref:cyclin-like protein n=1 Tax=Fimicolochytrium jonesii TaxID=1396493 RepID=UPI0022FF21F1|nr:cyclin-like protein [Fimicolochytrium jonesii]KAI8825671.1 cyclin-like protein [Fimicolochytrium jonesii]
MAPVTEPSPDATAAILSQLFEESSQFRHWKFTPEELRHLREKVNREGAERVRKAYAEQSAISGKDEPIPECISWEEQQRLSQFYVNRLVKFCKAIKPPLDRFVQATAVVFFKRFYLRNTMMDYDPKVYFLTCLFLSTKVENQYIPLRDFLAQIPKAPTAEVMKDYEFQLSQGIRFEYQVHHPFWPLHGFFLDVQNYILSAHPKAAHDLHLQRLTKTYHRAEQFAALATLSELIFTHMPAQIGFGCLLAASRENDFEKELEKYLTSRFHAEADNLARLRVEMEAIVDIVTKQGDINVPKGEAKDIDTKLDKCKNPEFDPTSELFNHRAIDEEQAKQERSALKSLSRQASAVDDAAFFL